MRNWAASSRAGLAVESQTVRRLSQASVSRRTLYRYLKAEGGTFRQVANEIRCEIACTLLAETDLPLSQIAEVMNYSEVSAFSRAFRRWSGQPPSVWRSNHRRLVRRSGRHPHARLRRS
jgi:AraC-like DNA-binding protein